MIYDTSTLSYERAAVEAVATQLLVSGAPRSEYG
jgi:hypothetical protein